MPRPPAARPSQPGKQPDAEKGHVLALSRAQTSDEELVQGIVEQRPAAIAELFDRFSALVRRTLVRTMGNAHDLDDLTQETFLTLIRRCKTLRDPSALRSFVVSVAIRTARNELRKRALRRFVGLDDIQAAPLVGPHNVELAEGVRRVYEALERLGTDGRIAFVLRHVEGYELTETATICGCSLATIKRRLARAEAQFEAISRTDPVLQEFLCTEDAP